MIQTEQTPNPNSLKFISEKTISAIGTEEFQKNKDKEIKNSFIKELLNFKGVELILLSKNFLSVKKNEETSWNELKPMVISPPSFATAGLTFESKTSIILFIVSSLLGVSIFDFFSSFRIGSLFFSK